MSGILNVLLGSSGLKAVTALFNRVVMLLPGNGSNGGTNNSFTDTGQGYAITRNGQTTQGTFTPFSQPDGYWGVSFNGTSDFLSLTTTAALTLGTGDFTIEYFYNVPDTVGGQGRISWGASGSPNIYLSAGALVTYTNYATSVLLTSSVACIPNSWNHIAVVRSAGVTTIYVNGVSGGSVADTTNWGIGSGTFRIMSSGGADFSSGLVSNVRIVKGTAVYTSAPFTPPTSPLTAITNTALLTCQSYRFKDNSTNNFTINTNSTPKITVEAPFTSGAAQNTGGSMLFDGSGDYLNTTASNGSLIIGTGDWTAEAFVYPFAYGGTSVGADIFAMSNGATGGYANGLHMNLGENIDRFRLISNASGTWADNITAGTGGGPRLYEWSHMAMVRQGDTISIFKNGTRVNTGTGFSAYKFTTTPSNYSLAVGGGPYLNTNRSATWGLNNYTIEFWVYLFGLGQDFIFNSSDAGSRLQVLMFGNGNLVMHQPGDLNFGGSSSNWTVQGWNHVAICRSSQSIAAWVNGTRLSAPQSNTYQPNTATFQIGPRNGGNNRCWLGPVRINSTTAIYAPSSSTITVPGATFGSVGGDIILCGQYPSATTDGSGATLTVVNGAYVVPFGANGTPANNAAPNCIVGRFFDGTTTRDFNGHIANVRFSNSAVYSATSTTLTVPTAPFTGGLFSVGATNGNITDATNRSDFETLNGAQISTAQSKWGGSSMLFFDGSNNGTGLQITSSATTYYQTYLNFGTGGFTIEAWVYITSTGVTHAIFYNDTGAQFQINTSQQLTFAISGTTIATSTTTISASTWTHVAVSRETGTGNIKLFIGGIQSASGTSTTSVPNSSTQWIGRNASNTTNLFRGYMNDLRVCNYGLYTTSFALPTAAFPTY